MAELKVGSVFQQAWKGCNKPMLFKVLELDRDKDYLRVKCTAVEGYSHEEEWQGPGDGLEFTEMCIDMGEYKLLELYNIINDKENDD